MGAGQSAEGEAGAYASDPPARDRRKLHQKRRRHSVDSVASYSSQNHVDRIRTQNFSATSCQDDADFGSIKTSLFRRASSNLEIAQKRPESVTSNTSSTRSRLRDLVERKSNQEEHKSAANAVADIQYFENPTETLEFDRPLNSIENKKSSERAKKRKLPKSKDKDLCESKNKKHDKYQSKLAEYYKAPVQLPQDEFYQHLTRSKAAEELLKKRFTNLNTELSGSYGRLCKHKDNENSNLRRSRSLAVIREETFTDLQIQNNAKNKRSQLIPRARLFDKPCFKDRLPGRTKYQSKEEVLENIYIESTASCFGDINGQQDNDNLLMRKENKSDREDEVSRHGSNKSRSISGSWPNLADEVKNVNLSEDSIGHSRNPSEIDSLDSNYVRKHYNFEAHLKNYKGSSPESERSIVSTNDCKQLYINADELESENDKDRSKNHTPKSYTQDSLSLTQSDKGKSLSESAGLDNKQYYDEVCEDQRCTDPKTNKKKSNITPEGDSRSVVSENDGTVSSPESITSYISISIASSTDKSHKLEHLANSLAEKIDEYCESQYRESAATRTNIIENNKEVDPIYTKVNKKKSVTDIKSESFLNKSNSADNCKNPVSEGYITNTYIESNDYNLKEDQRLCTSTRNITTEPFVTTLIENQYYSLPDINISKCLRKSERIDAQLREEDPEDIVNENTYEIAETNFREIFTARGNSNYGQLNPIRVNKEQTNTRNNTYTYTKYQQHPIQNFSKLEDDLKSIITIESSDTDEHDLKDYFCSDAHQNEREINEIENTIRNTKLITKSQSLKISSGYRPEIHLSKSLSNDNINSENKIKASKAIKKHYSLRQRDPYNNEIDRMPSPNTVARSFKKPKVTKLESKKNIDTESHALLSRVQSFKTKAESNIAIIPLSGHQTLVIDPPISQINEEINKIIAEEQTHQDTVNQIQETQKNYQVNKISEHKIEPFKKVTKTTHRSNSIDTSSYYTPKDPFITIKLNRVVKATIPKLKKETSDKIAAVQYKFEKPPARLIIKDNKNTCEVKAKPNNIMTRPQVLQVYDSKPKSQNSSGTKCEIKSAINDQNLKKVDLVESKSEHQVHEKLKDVIKTDIEYQEKLHSVKSYWSRLSGNGCESGENSRLDSVSTMDLDNEDNLDCKSADFRDIIEDKRSPEVSVGTIVKSIESVKIVDSIRKLSQTKLHLWRDETEKVKSDTEVEETTVKKIIKDCEQIAGIDKAKINHKIVNKPNFEWTRDTPEIEIVELSSDDNKNQKTQATLIKAKGFNKDSNEFDHVRYKVMKSELFKNSMIANYRKEAQFDGLLQYLQDYSFQELLVNNNIVIIEPVRTKVEPAPKKNSGNEACKISPSLLKKNDGYISQTEKTKAAIRRHFFYHPIRVNKEIIEEELPNPDTVKKVRNLFEDTLKMKSPMTHDPPLVEDLGLTRRATSYRNLNEDSKGNKTVFRKRVLRQLTIDTNYGHKKWDNVSLSSGVSSGDLSSNNEYEHEGLSPYSHKMKDIVYSSSDEYLCDSLNHEFCCESQYVSPDILKKIRECGTSVTYYGGKVLNSKPGSIVSPMTKAIMEEIKGLQKNCSRDCYSCQTKCRGERCSCLHSNKHVQMRSDVKESSSTSPDSGNHDHDKRSDGFPGFKFKLIKSNSCSSRLELTGTDDIKNNRNRYRKNQCMLEDPPLIYDDENSVKNKICRLESYNKGIAKTPFESNSDSEDQKVAPPTQKHMTKHPEVEKKIGEVKPQPNNMMKKNENNDQKKESLIVRKNSFPIDITSAEKQSFENKFYYVNDNSDKTKAATGKFGEMVFEEFEVLESCYDSLNSNKSVK